MYRRDQPHDKTQCPLDDFQIQHRMVSVPASVLIIFQFSLVAAASVHMHAMFDVANLREKVAQLVETLNLEFLRLALDDFTIDALENAIWRRNDRAKRKMDTILGHRAQVGFGGVNLTNWACSEVEDLVVVVCDRL